VAKGVAAHIDGDEPLGSCNIENISVGGVFIRTKAAMPIGMPVRVDLSKRGLDAPLSLPGRIVSVVSSAEAKRQDIAPGLGIEFDPMPHTTEKQLHTLLRELGLKDLADPIEPHDLHATTSPDTAQVASNVQGLLGMLTDALQKLKDRDEEILKLKAEIRKLKTSKP
jgi:Tfp pilus assembly protein PilZ